MKKTLISTLIIIGILYLTLCIYFYNIQNSILFRPSPLEDGHNYSYTFEFEERWFDGTDNGVKIHAIYSKPADSTKGLVIYFHGNGGNNDTNSEKFELFMSEGYDVLMPDYRSFGLSEGNLANENDLVGDMKNVYSEMTKEYPEENIFIVGYSLGSGVAAQVAAANNPKGLMIWAPYYSMDDMKNNSYPFLPSVLLRYPLRTDLAIPEIDEPITIFFAGEDELLPLERSIKLVDLLKSTDNYYVLEGQRHGGIFYNKELIKRIPEILEGK